VLPVFHFAGIQFVDGCPVDSGQQLLNSDALLVDVFGSYDSRLLKDFQGLKRHVKAAVNAGQGIVDFGFHGGCLVTKDVINLL